MNKHFIFEGHDTVSLAQVFGTPLYVYSRPLIQENIKKVEMNFLDKHKNTKAYYASKAFLTLEMARIIRDSKLGIDVASSGELYIALQGGINPENILYHGNYKSEEELLYALNSDVGKIVVDNLRELALLNELSINLQKEVNILIRFSPQLKEVYTHKNIQTGHKTSKFGFNLNVELDPIIEIVKNNKYLNFLGIHFHVGSQLHTNKNHLEAIDIVFNYIKTLKEDYSIIIKELNIGGGFGIKYNCNDHPISIEEFTDPSIEKIKDLSKQLNIETPTVTIEPGRSIVGETAVTLYKVGTTKQKDNNSRYLTINGGMTDNLRVALYDGKYECDISNKYRKDKNELYTIVGNACESTDVMIKDVSLPLAMSNDILVVHNTGAYEHSLSNTFNKMTRPCVLMVDTDDVKVIERRESLKDLISRQK